MAYVSMYAYNYTQECNMNLKSRLCTVFRQTIRSWISDMVPHWTRQRASRRILRHIPHRGQNTRRTLLLRAAVFLRERHSCRHIVCEVSHLTYENKGLKACYIPTSTFRIKESLTNLSWVLLRHELPLHRDVARKITSCFIAEVPGISGFKTLN